MANYQNLKAAISAAIRTNGNQEITGQVLQDVLNSIVSVIGANYTFAGVATPATNPGTPDQNVIYLAMEGGAYTNFNGTVLPAGISLLMWNGSWTSETVMYGDGGVFDISVYKSSGGTLATFADLAAALNGGNNIPVGARKGGMSVKFVQSSDNNYMQYRLMSNTFSINEEDWQSVNEYIKESAHYIFTFVDSEDNMIIGVTKEGKLICDEKFLSLALAKPLSLKVNVSSIVDNLTTERVDVPLSAKQGFTLKGLIDTLNTALGITNERISEIESGVSFITSSKYLIALVDADENVMWGIKKDGKLFEPTRYEESTNWLFALTDDSDNVVFGIKKDGSIYAPGLDIESFNNAIATLRDDIENIQENLSELNDSVEELNTIEVAVGNQKSYGTYESERAACPLSDNISEYNVKYKTIGKDRMLHEPKKTFVVMNHDDGFPGDLTATRRIYNKYGFKGSICAVFFPFQTLSVAKQTIPNYKKWLKDGHEIGLHAIILCSYWYCNRLYDVKPDGSTSFAPQISELRGSNVDGTGTNTFGSTITADTTIRNAGYGAGAVYNTANLDVKVVEATQAQLDDVNRGLCFYGDRFILSGIEDLEIEDIMNATSATAVDKTRIQWLEYYYNRLVENVGYSSTSSDITTRFAEDYDYPSGSTAADYYPDAEHLLNGKMVYYGDTSNPHYNDADYQKVGKFKKGIFKGCFSCCNWEVMDRCIACADAFFHHYYGLNHFTDMHRHGIAYTTLFYMNSGIHYLERSNTILNDSHSKFYVSHRNAMISLVDVLNEQGIDALKENANRQALDTEGQIGYFLGQKGIKTERGFGGTSVGKGSFTDYLAMFGTTDTGMETMSYNNFMAFIQGIDNWFKFCYENAGTSVTRNGLTMNVYNYIRKIAREVVGCIGTGKVFALSVDTINRSPAIFMAVDLVHRFFKDNGIEVLSWGAGRDKILSEERYTGGNLFPNAGFNQTLLQYLGGSSTDKDAYIPDGWFYLGDGGSETYTVGNEVINGINTRVFTITGKASIETNIYCLPQGEYKLSYDVMSSVSGSTEFKYSRIGSKYGSFTNIDTYTHTNEMTTKEVTFSIDAPHRNPVDESNPISVISDGYEDNIHRLVFRLKSTDANNVLKIANVKLYKI